MSWEKVWKSSQYPIHMKKLFFCKFTREILYRRCFSSSLAKFYSLIIAKNLPTAAHEDYKTKLSNALYLMYHSFGTFFTSGILIVNQWRKQVKLLLFKEKWSLWRTSIQVNFRFLPVGIIRTTLEACRTIRPTVDIKNANYQDQRFLLKLS